MFLVWSFGEYVFLLRSHYFHIISNIAYAQHLLLSKQQCILYMIHSNFNLPITKFYICFCYGLEEVEISIVGLPLVIQKRSQHIQLSHELKKNSTEGERDNQA